MAYLPSWVKLPEGPGPVRVMVIGTLGEYLLVADALDAGHRIRQFSAIVHGGDPAGQAAERWAERNGVCVEPGGPVDVLIVFRRVAGDIPEAQAQAEAMGVPVWLAFGGFAPAPAREKWSRHSYQRGRQR